MLVGAADGGPVFDLRFWKTRVIQNSSGRAIRSSTPSPGLSKNTETRMLMTFAASLNMLTMPEANIWSTASTSLTKREAVMPASWSA